MVNGGLRSFITSEYPFIFNYPKPKAMHKLPHEVFTYIRDHFLDGHLVNVKTTKDEHGHLQFHVEVSENDVVHHLEYNEEGGLTKRWSDPAFDEDYYEGDYYGEREE